MGTMNKTRKTLPGWPPKELQLPPLSVLLAMDEPRQLGLFEHCGLLSTSGAVATGEQATTATHPTAVQAVTVPGLLARLAAGECDGSVVSTANAPGRRAHVKRMLSAIVPTMQGE